MAKSIKTLAKLRKKIIRTAKSLWYYEGSDHRYIDFTLSAIGAHHWRDDPLWAMVLGPPGCGKTAFLGLLLGHKDVVMVSKLTTKALISGWQGKDQSLLPHLDGKILVMKDLTTLLQSDPRTRNEVIGQLRGAYDGTEGAAFGIGGAEEGIKEYRSHFTVLAACTPTYEQFHSVNQQMGERFVYRKFRHVNLIATARRALQNQNSKTKGIIDGLSKMLHAFYDLSKEVCPKIDTVEVPAQHQEEIIYLAMLVARARTHIHRNGYTKAVESNPSIETPTRLVQQFQKLARANAYTSGRLVVNREDMRLVTACAGDSIPYSRYRLIQQLYTSKRTRMVDYPETEHMQACDIKQLAKKNAISRTVMQRHVEDLTICGILKEYAANGTHSKKYALEPDIYKTIKSTQLNKSGKKDVWSNGHSKSMKKTSKKSKR